MNKVMRSCLPGLLVGWVFTCTYIDRVDAMGCVWRQCSLLSVGRAMQSESRHFTTQDPEAVRECETALLQLAAQQTIYRDFGRTPDSIPLLEWGFIADRVPQVLSHGRIQSDGVNKSMQLEVQIPGPRNPDDRALRGQYNLGERYALAVQAGPAMTGGWERSVPPVNRDVRSPQFGQVPATGWKYVCRIQESYCPRRSANVVPEAHRGRFSVRLFNDVGVRVDGLRAAEVTPGCPLDEECRVPRYAPGNGY